MALDMDGHMLSRAELETKVLKLEKDFDLIHAFLVDTAKTVVEDKQKIAELDTAAESLSLLNAQLLARVAKLESIMGDGGK